MRNYFTLLSAAKRYLLNIDKFFLKKEDWDKINPILVVSTGRTGTKFFASYFNNHFDDFWAVHEPFPKIDLLAAGYFKGKFKYSRVKNTLRWRRKFMQRELYIRGYANYLESNPALWSLIPVMKDIMPHAKIIHVIRDGRSWLRSAYSRKFDVYGNLKRDRNGILWKFTSNEISIDQFSGKWDEMNMIEKLAWIWKVKNENILNDISSDPNAITVRFEDIFYAENNYRGIDKIIDFISQDYSIHTSLNDIKQPLREKMNTTQAFLLPEYEKWTMEQKRSFERIAGDFMKKVGYF
jgi:hypothetical protein